MKTTKKVLVVLLIVFVIAQFFKPKKNEGNLASINVFLAETKPPEKVKLILKETCYDCHSNVTRYPWYNNITPLNYWLDSHVTDGKKHLNFSNWEGNSVKRKDHKFEEIIEMVQKKEMPLKSYTWSHPEAKLTENQIKAITNWATLVRTTYSLIPEAE